MSTTFRQIYQGAAFRADLSVNGVGPHSSERVTDPEWRTLLNEAIKKVWRLAASARPDFQVTSQDFVVSSGPSASFALPTNFFDTIDVVFGPDTPAEYSLGPFAWQNRRSPGGWFPANFGNTANYGGNAVRVMGGLVYIEPSLRAGGTYRLWYCPAPTLVRADTTVRLATTGALPAVTASGAGPGKTLTATGNGALTIDGALAVALDLVLIYGQANQADNGIYVVTNAGSAGTAFALTRSTSFNAAAQLPVGLMVYTSAGLTQADQFFQLTSTVVTVDTSAQTFAEAVIDPILEQFVELLECFTAMPVMIREDDLDPRPLSAALYGGGGDAGGLVGELKAYFGRTRYANGPGVMTDTDARGPRSWWST